MQELKSLEDASAFRFCGLVLDTRRRLLLDGERVLPLGGRALDILRVLLQKPGELVGKQTLMARVWPGAVVEDINLRVHISALRRVLRPYSTQDPILSARHRGYGFALAVERLSEEDLTPLAETPLPLTPLEGRETSLVELRRLLAQRRLVSVVGTGGVGKSLLVQHLLPTLAEGFPDGVQSLDLAALGHMMALVERLASDLGLASGSGLPALQEALFGCSSGAPGRGCQGCNCGQPTCNWWARSVVAARVCPWRWRSWPSRWRPWACTEYWHNSTAAIT